MTELELLKRLKLRPRKLVVAKPKLMGLEGESKTTSGIWKPGTANRGRREWGFLCRVLKVGDEVHREGILPSTIVLITEFAGVPIHYCGTDLNLWLIALGDIVATVEDADGVSLENDPTLT